MEDAHITSLDIDTNSHLFSVFDGHGGSEIAIFVERHFGNELVNNPNYKTGNFPQALIDTFLRMDDLILTPEGIEEIKQIKDDKKKGDAPQDDFGKLRQLFQLPDYDENGKFRIQAGCTSNVAFIRGDRIYVANAGDSRSVLARAGKAVAMSFDHKPDNEIERNRITKAGGSIVDGRVNGNLNLSRSLGDLEYKKDTSLRPEEQLISAYPDIKEETIDSETDFLILACDGIWDVMTNQEAVDFVYERLRNKPLMRLSEIVEEMLEHCCAPTSETGLGCDNMTCIIVTLK